MPAEKPAPELPADAAAFDVDLEELQRLLLQKNSNTHERQRAQMEAGMLDNMLGKYRRLCVTCNVDYMSDLACSVIFALCSRFAQKKEITDSVLAVLSSDGPLLRVLEAQRGKDGYASELARILPIDRESFANWHAIQCSTFNTVSDWILLFSHVYFAPNIELRLESHPLTRRMHNACEEADLASCYHLSTPFLCIMLLHVSVDNVPSVKLLERFLAHQQSYFVRDLEIRVLRAVSFYNDTSTDAGADREAMAIVYAEARLEPHFFLLMQKLELREHDSDTTNANIHALTPQRLQLRFLQAPSAPVSRDAMHSFAAWAAQQQFSVVSSRQRQLILYYALVHPKKLPHQLLAEHYTPAIVARYAQCPPVARIDVDALAQLLHSVRVYRNNITTLVDFRATCLRGLSARQRDALSLVNVFQLYVVVFQHPSVVHELWKRFCAVLNHTTITCIDDFARSHECEHAAVIVNLIGDDNDTVAIETGPPPATGAVPY